MWEAPALLSAPVAASLTLRQWAEAPAPDGGKGKEERGGGGGGRGEEEGGDDGRGGRGAAGARKAVAASGGGVGGSGGSRGGGGTGSGTGDGSSSGGSSSGGGGGVGGGGGGSSGGGGVGDAISGGTWKEWHASLEEPIIPEDATSGASELRRRPFNAYSPSGTAEGEYTYAK